MKRQASDYFEEEQRELKRQLVKIERQIAYLEEQYLTRTKFCGNILTGFTSYIIEKTLSIHSDDKVRLQRSERLFSLSSTTSPISRAHGYQYNQNRNSQRLTRNSIKQNQMEIEEKPQQAHSIQEMSIDSNYSREGSLNKHPQSSERFLPDYRSAGDISRTLSEDSHFYSRETEEFSDVKLKPKRRQKVQTSDKKICRKIKLDSRLNVQQQRLDDKNSSIEFKVDKEQQENNEIRLQVNEELQKDEEKDSLDSVQIFMRMAQN